MTKPDNLEKLSTDNVFERDVMQFAIDSSGIGIWDYDIETGKLIWSQSLYDMFGIDRDADLELDTIKKLIHPDDYNRYESEINRATEQKEKYDIEYRNIQPDGKIIWGRHIGRSIYDEDGATVRMIGVSYDITGIKEAEAKAEAADLAKSQFLANMSHEIRTPMNGVMGMAELLAATELTSKQKSFANIIVKSGESLLTIINDILDFSKIEAGEMELFPESFDFADAIEDVAILMSSTAAEKDVELIVRFDPALPRMVTGDAGRIRQVISNLISNAIKFTMEGHVLVDVNGELTGKSNAGVAKFTVRIEDTGVGIPAEKQRTIFNEFTQVDNSATRTHEGTGLGLSICKSLIELMGGKIYLDSEVGKGSVFWFDVELPVEAATKERTFAPSDVTGARVLIIDDNSVNRSILEEQMMVWRFESKSAASGEEGIAMLRAAPAFDCAFDLVILDYHMPDMTGVEVAEVIRADENMNNTPIIMLTSVDSANVNQELKQLDVQGHLIKPTKASQLLETIIETLQRSPLKDSDRRATSATLATMSEAYKESERALAADESLDVLIAEDNEVNKTVYTQILEHSGISFKIASNGQEAVEMFSQHSPKVVVMDISMPVMNGYAATEAIRELEKAAGNHTPIVGATAHAMTGDMEKCLEAGMDDYLSKPISPKRFIEKIEQWVSHSNERRRSNAGG